MNTRRGMAKTQLPYHKKFETMKQQSENTLQTQSTANTDYSNDYDRSVPMYYKDNQGRDQKYSLPPPREDLPSFIEQQINKEKRQAQQHIYATGPPVERDYQPPRNIYAQGNATPRSSERDMKHMIHPPTKSHGSVAPGDQGIKVESVRGQPVRERVLPRSTSERPRRSQQQNGVPTPTIADKAPSERNLQAGDIDVLAPSKFAPDVEKKLIDKMRRMATDMSKKGNFKEAQETLLKVVRTQEVSLGRNSAELASSRLQLGVAFLRSDQLKDALSQLREAQRVLLKFNSSHTNADLASTLFHSGFVLAKLGQVKEAISELERSQKLEIKLFGKTLDQTSRLLWDLECKSANKH